MVKVAQNRWLIAAASGNAVSTLALKRAVQKGASTADALLEHVDAESYALVLLPTGRVLKLSEGQIWACAPGKVEAIGSGADLAKGFIAGVLSERKPRVAVTPWLARSAQRFVARERVDCGGGCDVRYFKAEK